MSGQPRRRFDDACRWAAPLVGVALAGLSRSAFAEPAGSANTAPSVGLAWSGPGPELTCLGEEGLARAVNEYIGRDAFAARSVDLILHVTVERLPDRHFRALLELGDTAGRVLGARELTSSTDLCSSLDEPLVLAVALMVDVDSESEVTRGTAPPAPPPEPTPDVPAPPSEHERPSQPLRLLADAALTVESGLLPHVEPGVSLGLELRAASWLSARASGLGFLPATADLSGQASVRFALFAAALELCPTVGGPESVRVSVCVGPLYGLLTAKPHGLVGVAESSSHVLALSAGLRVSVPFHRRWTAFGGLAGVIPHRPDRFVYDQNGTEQEVFRMAGFSVLAAAGVSFLFF